jgi:DNA repair exonuclease SbcCD ATPase subunit
LIIHKLSIQNFFGFKSTDLELPQQGIVVLTGKNGKGKTARTITAPSWCVWEETERGTPPYPNGTKPNITGEIEVTTGRGQQLVITRTMKGKTRTLAWTVDGVPAPEHSTHTKAQEALEKIVGEYMTWRRTHVFSGADAAMFSHADDATRKRLLEAMLSLDIFDAPLQTVREELKTVGARSAHLAMKGEALSNQRKQLLAQAKEVKALVGEDIHLDPDAIKREIEQLQGKKRELQQRQVAMQQEMAESNANLMQLQRELTKLGDGTCRTCGQSLPHADIAGHKAAVEAAQAEHAVLQASARTNIDKAARIMGQIDEQLQERISELDRARKAKSAEALLEKYRGELQIMKEQLAAIEVDLEDADFDQAVMTHAARVLSTKGVRSLMLGRALASLTALANAYLEQLRPGISIELLPTSETKGGKVVDAISLNIHGMGGGWGYKATSGGERKRVDIALLLALSALSNTQGTLIFDEAMDAIDDEGVLSVCTLLESVSQNRPVVLITHNTALANGLTAAKRIQLT